MLDQLKELKWGSFTPTHFVTLILSVCIIVALYFILRHKSEKTQRLVLFILSLTAPASLIYNIVVWGLPGTVLEYLPFHLCSINAMLLPFLAWRKDGFLGNLLPVYSVGAVAALVFNSFMADFPVFDHVFLVYYLAHTFEFGIPMLMLALGQVKIRPKHIAPCLITTFVLYTGIHFINLGLNQYLNAKQYLDSAGNVIQVNYMYSLGPMGNPALEFFWSILPYEYFYMLITIPLFAVVYALMNLPSFIAMAKARQRDPA